MADKYEYDEILHEIPDKGGAYVAFPWNIKEKFGKGRLKVHAEFDGIPYDGSVVNMGVKTPEGEICYIIGVPKAIPGKTGKKEWRFSPCGDCGTAIAAPCAAMERKDDIWRNNMKQ